MSAAVRKSAARSREDDEIRELGRRPERI